MSNLIGVKPDKPKVTVADILKRHEDAGKIIAALALIDKHLTEQLALSKSPDNDRELHLSNVAQLSNKRTEARRNYVVYVKGTIDMAVTV